MRSLFAVVLLFFSVPCFAQDKVIKDSLLRGHYFSPIPTTHLFVVLQDQYAKNIGFFCKQELKMQQAHIPVSFRLGSMDYVNRLEQKPGYRTPNLRLDE